ncbi:RNA methyltransferase [Phyllobacterium brassicacearum]|uniref:RNA methyltransferase n=1 Tax=Phyllobacterium brassicacearum TaxID=314235 RepID=A0A2P7AJN3_9HYPH|nr:RNA methyltransferase [Phyllobacterium brassicacearum]PSH54421.1 RNA methyltransferase [Phyllobacterium brassicacearum]TDQ30513.1 tRNA G18 (ribose-2'-O)-methylase SpoU [Phyllobacterium brassicacearum]
MTSAFENPDWLEHRVTRIINADDERLAPYRNVRERDLVGREGRFIAEGKVVLNVFLSNPALAVESLLILENRLPGLAGQLKSCRDDVPVYCVSRQTMDAIAGFPMHRGILAVGRRNAPPTVDALIDALPNTALTIVLCGISNHDNMGSIFRNAAAFEASCVLMDETSCDPLYRKSIRVSVGAALKVPFARGGSIEDIVDKLQNRGFEVFALSPSGTTSIYDAAPGPRTALLLGTEGEGLPKSLLQKLQTVTIPMSKSFDSLNVATASGIALSRFSRFSGI